MLRAVCSHLGRVGGRINPLPGHHCTLQPPHPQSTTIPNTRTLTINPLLPSSSASSSSKSLSNGMVAEYDRDEHHLFTPTSLLVMEARRMSMLTAAPTRTSVPATTTYDNDSSHAGAESSNSSRDNSRSSYASRGLNAMTNKTDSLAGIGALAAVPLDRKTKSTTATKRAVNIVRRTFVRRGAVPPPVVASPAKKVATTSTTASAIPMKRASSTTTPPSPISSQKKIFGRSKPAAIQSAVDVAQTAAKVTPVPAKVASYIPKYAAVAAPAITPLTPAVAMVAAKRRASSSSAAAAAAPAPAPPAAAPPPFTITEGNVVVIHDPDGPLLQALLSHPSLASLASLYDPQPWVSMTQLAQSLPSLRLDPRLAGPAAPSGHQLLLQLASSSHARIESVAQRMMSHGRTDYDSLPFVFAPGTHVRVRTDTPVDGEPQWMSAEVKSARFIMAGQVIPAQEGQIDVIPNHDNVNDDVDVNDVEDVDDDNMAMAGAGFLIEVDQLILVRGPGLHAHEYHTSGYGTFTRTIVIPPFGGVTPLTSFEVQPLLIGSNESAAERAKGHQQQLESIATRFAGAWAYSPPVGGTRYTNIGNGGGNGARVMRWTQTTNGTSQDVVVIPTLRHESSAITSALLPTDAWKLCPLINVFVLGEGRWASVPIKELSVATSMRDSPQLSLPIRSLTVPSAATAPQLSSTFAKLLVKPNAVSVNAMAMNREVSSHSPVGGAGALAVITGVSGMGKRTYVRDMICRYHTNRPLMTLSTDDRQWFTKLNDAATFGAITMIHTRASVLFRPSVYQPLVAALQCHGGAVVLVVDSDRLIPGEDEHVPEAIATRAVIDIHFNMLDTGALRIIRQELINHHVVDDKYVIPSFEQAVPLSLFLASLRAQAVHQPDQSIPAPVSASQVGGNATSTTAASSSSTNSTLEVSTDSGDESSDDIDTTTGSTAAGASTHGGPVVYLRSSML